MLCLVAQCLTLYDPTDYSPPGSSFHVASPGKNTGVGCHALLQRIFPIQRSNPGLPHCREILYHLSYQGSPRILEWVAYPFLQQIFPTQEWNQGLLHCRWILFCLSHQGSPGILEWVAMPSFRESSQPRPQTQVSHIAVRFFTI